ncbi:MAG: NADH-quinone oxidoreductase subunit C [Alphaproteobacteria bacterium]|jgi:NADH-quinone oxidoreductase subunit C|nr:NADH-quinone oxidoreductase subunit C [Rhodospirillaceae bacterium]MDP6020515.1 NADH-quinone oxidoreductase subunit C [Alphaproteobacteria bacterium]MDP6253861.1 NADH-quinone oxidoreductase subunit C [Alphaproteobacteria bacterium]MDP7052664.1 NADH-quinone oxidoreductase subunit C [Alphaproteobacteria bacterium]MDP7229781.1 NADH-quinone oxidoreductase subunit C [Alphaproteobacteria bacterium]|tara:strand:+ start:1519 stop:2148 length:630 start_codon:yes stop_codon:yes gene_type:complete
MADDGALQDLGQHIAAVLADQVIEASVAHGELIITARAEQIIKVVTFLRDDPQCLFKVMVDICGIDFPERPKRFEVVYNFLSLVHNQRVRVKVDADDQTPVPSITSLHNSANWFEREVWDMYGVMFDGHPDLRRLLTDYGFEGHPLRKDFPLTGFVEVRYDDERKRVVYDPVKLPQEFRKFDFLSPWEGATAVPAVLPGDEKADGQEPS